MLAEGFYDEPLLYDVLHGPGTAAEIRGLVRIAERTNLDPRGPWLEPACGSGRYVRAAVARGVRIAAFDASEAMVRYAQRRMRGVHASRFRLSVANMEDFDAQDMAPGWTFEFAFNPINTIRHLDSDRSLLAHLRLVHDTLRPGGIYAVGLSLSVYGAEQPSEDVWSGSRGRLTVRQVVQYTPAGGGRDRAERVHSVLHVQRPSGSQVIPTAYALRSYDHVQWGEIIRRSPFELLGCTDEDGQPMEAPTLGYALWLLGRPKA